MRQVAVHDETWRNLLGWQAGAFKVRVRDEWIGWSPDQQFSRLPLMANNARFLVLDEGRFPNLAPRVFSLSRRRLEGDRSQVHGYPVYLAETFVDPSQFAGTCYRAANWQFLGLPQGFSRESGGTARWRPNGQPKPFFIYPLRTDASELLCHTEELDDWQPGGMAPAPSTPEPRSLYSFLESLDDFRHARGKRYRLACFIAIAVRLAGYRGVTAFGEFAAGMSQEQLKAVGAFWSSSQQRYTAPATSTFHYILSQLEPDTLDRTIGKWVNQPSDQEAPVALDGKNIRGASAQLENENWVVISAVEHGTGLVLGQTQVSDKTNEIPAGRDLSRQLELTGRVVTFEARHVQPETAPSLLEDCGAGYVMSSVKDNQPTIFEDGKPLIGAPLQALRSQQKRRRCQVVDISGSEWDGYCELYGRQQARRLEREPYDIKEG